jgi:hypothetical protein
MYNKNAIEVKERINNEILTLEGIRDSKHIENILQTVEAFKEDLLNYKKELEEYERKFRILI